MPWWPTLCTVRLSRRILSDHDSYRLDALAGDLGIDMDQHHRATSDAEAAAGILLHIVEDCVEVVVVVEVVEEVASTVVVVLVVVVGPHSGDVTGPKVTAAKRFAPSCFEFAIEVVCHAKPHGSAIDGSIGMSTPSFVSQARSNSNNSHAPAKSEERGTKLSDPPLSTSHGGGATLFPV